MYTVIMSTKKASRNNQRKLTWPEDKVLTSTKAPIVKNDKTGRFAV